MNENTLEARIAEVRDRCDWQAERAGTSPAALAWQDAADMVREALES
jgi:hypothetical protein